MNFERANLEYAQLKNTDLSCANLFKCKLGGVDFKNAILNGAIFDVSEEELKKLNALGCEIIGLNNDGKSIAPLTEEEIHTLSKFGFKLK